MTLAEATSLVIPFGHKFKKKTIGQIIAAGDEGFDYINWIANLRAVNGTQPREDRVRIHNAAKFIVQQYPAEVARAMETRISRLQAARGKPRGWKAAQQGPEVVDL